MAETQCFLPIHFQSDPLWSKKLSQEDMSGCHSCLLNSKLFNSASLSVSCYVKYVPHPTGTDSYIISKNKSDPSDGAIRWYYFNYHLIVYLIIIYHNWRSDMWDLVAFISVEKNFYQNPPHLVSPFVVIKSTEDRLQSWCLLFKAAVEACWCNVTVKETCCCWECEQLTLRW